MKYISSLLVIVAFATTCNASMIINFSQVGNDVVADGSGTLNPTGLNIMTPAMPAVSGAVLPSIGAFAAFSLPTNRVNVYRGYTGPSNFGSGNILIAADIVSSNFNFGFITSSNELYIEQNYLGDEIKFTETYLLKTFVDLGLTPGTYIWNWAGDSITMNINDAGPSSVPEPGTITLVGAGLAGLAARYRRRKVEEVA